MSEVVNANRTRSTASDPDRAEELWTRLREASAQARSLAATNRKLAAQVASLERQVVQTGGLSDDDLLAELPRRMSRALESAQEVAEELVSRAKKRDEAIRQRTDERAAAVVAQAEAEATAVLRRAAREAVARVAEAEAEAQAILQAAHARHDQVLAHLQEQAAVLEDRVSWLHHQHGRLGRAYELLERTLGEAKVALRNSMEAAGPPPPPPSSQRNGRRRPAPSLYAVGDDEAVQYNRSPVSGRT